VQICCNVVDRGSSYKPYALLVMAVSRTAGSWRKKGLGVIWSARSTHEPTREHAAINVKKLLRDIGYEYNELMISVYCVLRHGMYRIQTDLLVSTFLRCVDKHNDSVQGMSVEFGAEARTGSAPSEREQLLSNAEFLRGIEGAIAMLSAELQHFLIGGIPLLQRLHDHDVHHSDVAGQGTGGIRDYFSDTVAVWMLRFAQNLQISIACRENPVTVMVIRTPVVKFLSYICRSVLEGKMKHLEALIPSLETVHAIDASLLPVLGELLLLMWRGRAASVKSFVHRELSEEARKTLRRSPLFQEFKHVTGFSGVPSASGDARICKEVLVNLHNEDRRQLRCRKAILRAEQGSLAFGPTLHSRCLSFGTTG
jgi:hypothetical protein